MIPFFYAGRYASAEVTEIAEPHHRPSLGNFSRPRSNSFTQSLSRNRKHLPIRVAGRPTRNRHRLSCMLLGLTPNRVAASDFVNARSVICFRPPSPYKANLCHADSAVNVTAFSVPCNTIMLGTLKKHLICNNPGTIIKRTNSDMKKRRRL